MRQEALSNSMSPSLYYPSILEESCASLEARESKEDSSKTFVVSFNDTVATAETLHHSDYTLEEHERCWVTSQEFFYRLEEADALAMELVEGGPLLDDCQFDSAGNCCCYRGLETRTPSADREYTEKYDTMVTAVLTEQKSQRLLFGCRNVERIAETCRAYTRQCAEDATYRAQRDERAVQAAYLSPL